MHFIHNRDDLEKFEKLLVFTKTLKRLKKKIWKARFSL